MAQSPQEGSIIRKIIYIRNKIKKAGGLPLLFSESKRIPNYLELIL